MRQLLTNDVVFALIERLRENGQHCAARVLEVVVQWRHQTLELVGDTFYVVNEDAAEKIARAIWRRGVARVDLPFVERAIKRHAQVDSVRQTQAI